MSEFGWPASGPCTVCGKPAAVILTRSGRPDQRCNDHSGLRVVVQVRLRERHAGERLREDWRETFRGAADTAVEAWHRNPSAVPPEIASALGRLALLLRARPPGA